MKELYKAIKKQNKGRVGWIVLWFLGLMVSGLKGNNYSDKISIGTGYIIFGAGLILLASIDYVVKYIIICKDEAVGFGFKRWIDGVGIKDGNLMKIMKAHSFDVDAYFNHILLRIFPLQLFSAAVYTAFIFLKILSLSDAMLAAAMCYLIPVMVILAVKILFKHTLSNDNNKTIAIIIGAGKGILNLAKSIASAVAGFMVFMVLFAMVSDKIILNGISESEAVKVSVMGGDPFVAMGVLGSIIGIYLLMDGSFHITGVKTRRILAVIAVITCISGMFVYSFTAQNDSITIREDSFTVNKDSEERVYKLEDVRNYRVYAESGAIQTELTMMDNRKIKLFGDSMDDTEAWKDKYLNEYKYAASLSEKFTKMGIKGSLEDKDRLSKIVDKLDSDCREGLEEIIEIMDVK
ncbi:hypothetical protein SAMN04487934_102162 [Eubacterium ruminantium]|nr:hypothetical protein SAMN04487934_102162 [Eubacterium ruminantium]